MIFPRSSLFLVSCLAFAGCTEQTTTLTSGPAGDLASAEQPFSSRDSVQLDFEFDGELISEYNFSPRQTIQDQFLYTIGHLNFDRSVGRLDRLVISNIQTSAQADGSYRITYHAKLPVAWGRKSRIPTSYEFTLPKFVGYTGLEEFTTKYRETCVDSAAHDVEAGSMWYYYRPQKRGCGIVADDVIKMTASVVRSTENTTGKYPEYQKVWEDDELNVVAIFGKYEKTGTTAADAGIDAFNTFAAQMQRTLGGLGLVTEPATIPSQPGIAAADLTFRAQLADGKTVVVHSLLVDEISSAPEAFY
jgi:hypothetical protein